MPKNNKKHLLVISQDAPFLKKIKEMGRQINPDFLEWSFAENASQAEVLLNKYQIDLVFFEAPLNSFEFLSSLAAKSSEMPFVIILDQEDSSLAKKSISAGCADFLIKNQIEKSLLQRVIRYTLTFYQAKKSLLQTREFFNLSENLIFEINSIGEVVFKNLAAKNYFAQFEESQIGSIIENIPLSQVKNKAYTKGEVVQFNKRSYLKKSLWMPNSDHHLVCLEDVTEKKPEEVEKSDDLELSLAMGDMSPWKYDLKEKKLSWHKNSAYLMGLTEQDLGETIEAHWERIHPEDRSFVSQIFEEALKNKREYKVEYRFLVPDQPMRWFLSKSEIAFDENWKPTKLCGMLIDITNYREIEQKVERLASIVEFSEDGVVGLTLDGVICDWNKGAAKMYGFTEKEALGKPIDFVLSDEDKKPFADMLVEIARGKEIDHFEALRYKKGGDSFYVSVTLSPVRNEKKEVIGISSVDRDISHQKKIEAQKNEFIGTVSHDLRTPLSIMKGAVDNICDGLLGPINSKQENVLKTTNRQIDRLTRMVRDLLDLSRLESSETVINFAKIDLGELVSEVARNMEMLAHAVDKSIELKLSETPIVEVDSDMVIRALGNLIDNAIRYSEKQISISTRVAQKSGFVEVIVLDDGPGIPKEKQEQIFSKFKQATRKEVAGYKGTGLGLAICREVVSLHKGEIWIESQLGKGSAFHFTLPIKASLQ